MNLRNEVRPVFSECQEMAETVGFEPTIEFPL